MVEQLAEAFKADYRQVIARFFTRDFSQHNMDADQSFFKRRHLLLALWQIRSHHCHLYQDMLDITAEGFLNHVQANFDKPDKDWHYQAQMFAGVVLATTAYYLKQDKPLPTSDVLLELQQMTTILCHNKALGTNPSAIREPL